MENKRKAAMAQAPGAADGDDRASKRRKVPAQQDTEFDLFKEETPESTTHYGQLFLSQIRRTTDKSGRKVATYFEELLPRKGNEDYYAQTRMPVSLQTVEKKLSNHEFSNLSELESYIKRMIGNAKDFYNRGTEVFDDAERVRKALSNYMVKTNPAYKQFPGYTAVPTPFPDDQSSQGDAASKAGPSAPAKRGGNARADAATGDNDDADSGADEDDDGEADDDDAGPSDEDEEGDDGSDSDVASKRKGGDRSSKKSEANYEGVAYKGLDFQKAQEKIIDEMVRKKEHKDDDYVQFDPFLNLPPRALKDYYQVIKEPLCLKKLQKLVRGIHSRRDKPGKSDYKSWAAFEEKVSLLWKNAYFYNEDGSEIAELAKEMEKFFTAQLKEAKAVVVEPPQPKLKLKVAGKEPGSAPLPRKITIHVAPGNSGAVDSSAPTTARSGISAVSDAALAGASAAAKPLANDSSAAPVAANPNLVHLDRASSGSSPAPSPAQAAPIKTEGPGQPAAASQPAVASPGAAATPGNIPNDSTSSLAGQAVANGQPASQNQVVTAASLYDIRDRQPGRGIADALISSLLVRSNPHLRVEPRFEFTLPADRKLTQQAVSVTMPASCNRVQVIPTINPHLVDGRRPYKLFVNVNGQVLTRVVPPPLPNDQFSKSQFVFDGHLYAGINKIVVQIVAAVPKDIKLANGADAEFEMFTVQACLVRY